MHRSAFTLRPSSRTVNIKQAPLTSAQLFCLLTPYPARVDWETWFLGWHMMLNMKMMSFMCYAFQSPYLNSAECLREILVDNILDNSLEHQKRRWGTEWSRKDTESCRVKTRWSGPRCTVVTRHLTKPFNLSLVMYIEIEIPTKILVNSLSWSMVELWLCLIKDEFKRQTTIS